MVRVAVPEMLPCVAMMVDVVFGVTPVARPPDVIVAPTEALQVTLLVMFCVLPSVYVPVAVNCCVPFGATDADEGVTAIDTRGLVTVSDAVPEIVPEIAVMVDVAPGVTPVANPPAAMLAPADALHVAVAVRSLVVPSLKLPVALNCCV